MFPVNECGESYIRRGASIFRRFCSDLDLEHCSTISVFDHHNVVDQFSEDEAISLGVALDHLHDHCSVLLSYGFSHRQEAFDSTKRFYPMINELDAYIFTDLRHNRRFGVEVYQDQWMRDTCRRMNKPQGLIIGMCGDKGQVAELLGKPIIFFDDKEENVVQVLQAKQGNEAYLVRIGERKRHPVRSIGGIAFTATSTVSEWEALCKNFHNAHTMEKTAVLAGSSAPGPSRKSPEDTLHDVVLRVRAIEMFLPLTADVLNNHEEVLINHGTQLKELPRLIRGNKADAQGASAASGHDRRRPESGGSPRRSTRSPSRSARR